MAQRRHRRAGKASRQDSAQRISFHIDTIDPLGQGVSRHDNKICFISKTLPGETGTARIMKRRAQVSFARIDKLETVSDQRIEPACKHYGECPGCHYLHTSYDNELKLKHQALTTLLVRAGINSPAIDVIGAPERLAYRNRIQLHYRHRYLGFADGHRDQIVEVPECQLLSDDIRSAVAKLYSERPWLSDRNNKRAGHCEVYFHNNEVSIAWDKPYAHTGFTQVYAAMNDKLKALVASWAAREPIGDMLDLFAGDGNLSDQLDVTGRRVMIDSGGNNSDSDFYQLDLYAPETLTTVRRKIINKTDLLMLDPPRKGLSNLNEWLQTYNSRRAIYVSCNPATLVRDLKPCLANYTIDALSLLDLFPATNHYETAVLLRAK